MPDGNTTGAALTPASGRRPTMIKGLVPSLPERGKIKIGMKGRMITSQRGNQFQPPQKLDHFIVTTLQRGADGNFVPDDTLMRRLGNKPTEIPVRLLYDDPVLNFPTRYACFIGRTLWCSGDGETATRLTETPKQTADGARPEPREVACTCQRQDPAYQGRDKCKMNGSLSVLVEGAGGVGGVWKFRTTSYNSIVGIMSSMAFMRSITGGVLANIPLKLRVQPKQATAPHDGSQVLIYIVTLEFDGDIAGLQTIAHGIALERAKTHVSIEHIEDEAKRLLALMPPSNAPLPGDDTDDIVEEFYSEQAAEGWAQQPRESVPPEPPRSIASAAPAAEPDEALFTVVDADGEEHEFTSVDGVAAGLRSIFSDAKRRGRASLEAAAENNQAAMQLLAEHDAALAQELADHWRTLMAALDPFGLPPLDKKPTSPELSAASSNREDVGSLESNNAGSNPAAASPTAPNPAWLRRVRDLADPAADLAGERDWRPWLADALALIAAGSPADAAALRLSDWPAAQLLRRENGDLYRELTSALAERGKVAADG